MSLIFVFGSNLSGRHGKGAALTARQDHGAVYGVAEGLTGQSYALPTCDHRFNALPIDEIRAHVERFIRFANSRQDLGFKVTRVGCGLAYYRDERIAPMFLSAPNYNVFFDTAWRPFLETAAKGFEYWGTY